MFGGAGDDTIFLITFNGVQQGDGGEGDDVFVVAGRVAATTIATGSGSDRIYIQNPGFDTPLGVITITDFTPGAGGDVFSLDGRNFDSPGLLSILSGWDGSTNPFAAGYFRLVQNGNDAVLEMDVTGSANGAAWATVAVFQNTDFTDFADANFSPGYNPTPTNDAPSANVVATAGDIFPSSLQAELEPTPSASGGWFESGEGGETHSLEHLDAWQMLVTTDIV